MIQVPKHSLINIKSLFLDLKVFSLDLRFIVLRVTWLKCVNMQRTIAVISSALFPWNKINSFYVLFTISMCIVFVALQYANH